MSHNEELVCECGNEDFTIEKQSNKLDIRCKKCKTLIIIGTKFLAREGINSRSHPYERL